MNIEYVFEYTKPIKIIFRIFEYLK